MPLTSKSRTAYFEMARGVSVDRAAATLPQTGIAALFTVSGGRIALFFLLGEFTVAHPAAANAVKLVSTPTVGTAVDLCTAVDLTGKELGSFLGLTGVLSDALQVQNAGAIILQDRPIVIPVGQIRINTAGNSTTAQVKWKLGYLPIDAGATIVAV